MGLTARPMPGGRTLVVTLELGASSFETIAGPMSIRRVVFSTVGADRIKCLRPRPLFGLPLIDVRDCRSPIQIEAAIRSAWRARTAALREAGRWLGELGVEAAPAENGSLVGFGLPGESPEARVLLADREEAILPSRGPLAGLELDGRSERVVAIGRGVDSAVDLECLIGAHMDGLRRNAGRREAERRERRARDVEHVGAPASALRRERATDAKPSAARPPQRRVLVVGPKLVQDALLRRALARRGYGMATARSETEALVRLAGMTPDLVLSEYVLGRSDGATLVQATRSLAGIEGMPVVLLDDARHESRREAARAVGAAGYVVNPEDRNRFVARLGQLLEAPGKRRFTRYPQRLSARVDGTDVPCLATQVGRGGVFLTLEDDADLHSEMHCEIALPELGRAFRFDGEVLYRAEMQGRAAGLGLRFAQIPPEDEACLIEYLTWLESRR